MMGLAHGLKAIDSAGLSRRGRWIAANVLCGTRGDGDSRGEHSLTIRATVKDLCIEGGRPSSLRRGGSKIHESWNISSQDGFLLVLVDGVDAQARRPATNWWRSGGPEPQAQASILSSKLRASESKEQAVSKKGGGA